jgi:hypothetical protein
MGKEPTPSPVAGSTKSVFMTTRSYNYCAQQSASGAVFQTTYVPVLKIEGNFSRLRARLAHLVGHLPRIREVMVALATSYGAVRERLKLAPTTMIHADLHLDNVLFSSRR